MVKIPNSSLLWDMHVSPRSLSCQTRESSHVFPACFLGALQFVAGNAGKRDLAAKAKIHSSVVLGQSAEMEGFALKVDIKVEGIEDESLIKAAHEVVHLRRPHWFSLLTCAFDCICSSARTVVLSGMESRSTSGRLKVQKSNRLRSYRRNIHSCCL